ncbi:hypothetical protein D6D17_10643 [Aureobasidium pullulans]|nr:hypothetical protein D6D17_10643 [Aureobasidium pullulans]
MGGVFDATDLASPGYYDPKQTALLLLDFHTALIEKMAGSKAPAALETAVKLREWAKLKGIMVIHGLINVRLDPPPMSKNREALMGVLNAMRNSGAEEPAELLHNCARDENTFTRTPGHISALTSPGIMEHLQKAGIRSLIVTGLSTSGCVSRTAFAATDMDFVVTTISDGCADPSQDIHDMLIEKSLPSRGYVLSAADFQSGYPDTSRDN